MRRLDKMKLAMTFRKVALLVTICVCSSLGKSGQTNPAAPAKLVVATDKQIYAVGEPITFRYFLQNIGTKKLYISPVIDDVSRADAGVLIILYDRNGAEVPGMVVAESKVRRGKNVGLVERIRNTWLLLSPRSFYGKESQYYGACDPDPGKYKMVARYYNADLAQSSAIEKGSLSSLPYPVLTESPAAEADFEIRGERSSKSCSDFHPGRR
jgi:hypothetical protein